MTTDQIKRTLSELVQAVEEKIEAGRFSITEVYRPGTLCEYDAHAFADVDGMLMTFDYCPDVDWSITTGFTPLRLGIRAGDILRAAAIDFVKENGYINSEKVAV